MQIRNMVGLHLQFMVETHFITYRWLFVVEFTLCPQTAIASSMPSIMALTHAFLFTQRFNAPPLGSYALRSARS